MRLAIRLLAFALLLVLTGCNGPDPRLVAHNPSGLIVSGSNLFWRESSGSLHVAPLFREDEARTVARPPSGGRCWGDVHLNRTSIFWNDSDCNLWHATLDGQNPARMDIIAEDAFAVDDENVYLADDWPAQPAQLVKQPLDGSATTTLAMPLEGLTVRQMVPHGGDLYVVAAFGAWSAEAWDKLGVWRVPIAGGPAVQLVPDPYVDGLAVSDVDLYWSSGGIHRAHLDGTDTAVLDDEPGSHHLRILGGRLFWLADPDRDAVPAGSGYQSVGEFAAAMQTIVSVALDGSDRRAHYRSHLVGLTGDASYVYSWERDATDDLTYHLLTIEY